MATCQFSGCDKPVKSRGYCQGHLLQLHEGRELKALRPRRLKLEVPLTCTVDGCDRPQRAKGLCDGHYQQARRGAELGPLQEYHETCTVEGCGDKHYCKGYCRKHYKRVLRTGDVHQGREPSEILEAKDYLLVEIRGPKRGGAWAKVDFADRSFVEGKSFSLASGGYARRWDKKEVYLAAELMSPPEGMQVDHVNGDRLDNRRSNLRLVTFAEQMQNKKAWASSRCRNVHKRGKGKWAVVVKKGGVPHYGGTFRSIPKADRVARSLRAKLLTHHNEARHPEPSAVAPEEGPAAGSPEPQGLS